MKIPLETPKEKLDKMLKIYPKGNVRAFGKNMIDRANESRNSASVDYWKEFLSLLK